MAEPSRQQLLDSPLTHNEQYRLLVEGIIDYAIYMLSPEGLVISWNPGAERFKGYQASEILGKHFSQFYSAEDCANGEPQRALETAMREGRFEREGWRLRKDGSRFWANVVIDPIRSATGDILGFAKVTRDITQRREAQLELDRANATLFQSQKMEAIGQLTGGIAHDFNNLLTAVLGSLEVVRRRLPAEDARTLRYVDTAILGAQRGISLTRRLLSFARRDEVKEALIQVPTLMQGVVDLVQSSLGSSVTIDTQFAPIANTIRGDANQIELALLNLALNGRDSMPRGGTLTLSAHEKTVPIGASRAVRPGQYIVLSVIDAGEGMDEATLLRATEPFFTTKAPGQGTGLGLSMVHGLMADSGGHFVLESVQGHGTTAQLWFPVEQVAGVDAGTAEDAPARGAGLRPLVILAVDDDDLILASMAALLEDLGHTVFEAPGGEPALAILRRETRIDLLVTDQVMPHMTGLQLIALARMERPGLPAILATGNAEAPVAADADVVRLMKPFRRTQVEYAVAQACRNDIPAGQAAAVPETT